MANGDRNRPRPLWVRGVVPGGTKRSAAVAQTTSFIGIFGIGLFLVCLGVFKHLSDAVVRESGSLIGANKLSFGLAFVFLGAAGAIWSMLAVRWVDRNGNWM
jgi:hypothetical protein